VKKHWNANSLISLCGESSLSFLLLSCTVVIATAMTYSQTVINFRQSFPSVTAGIEGRDGFFVLVVIIPIAVLYTFLHPVIIRLRDSGSSRIVDTSPLHTRLRELSALLEVKCPALFLANKGFDQTAQAFGCLKYAILLGQGMETVLMLNKPLFDAIVLHELGHIKNKDVRKAYFTRGLTGVYVLVVGLVLFLIHGLVLINLVKYHLCSRGAWFCLSFALKTLIGNTLAYIPIALMVAISYALFLKIREYQADYVASSFGAKQELIGIFNTVSLSRHNLWWKDILSLHPTPKQRKRALERPSTIFKTTRWLSIVAGCLFSVLQTCLGRSPSVAAWSNYAIEHWKKAVAGQELMTPILILQVAFLFLGALLVTSITFLILVRAFIRLGIWASSGRRVFWSSIFQCLLGALFFLIGYQYLGDFVVYFGLLINFGAKQYYLVSALSDSWSIQSTRALLILILIILSFLHGFVFSKIIGKLEFPRFFVSLLCLSSLVFTSTFLCLVFQDDMQQIAQQYALPPMMFAWQALIAGVVECVVLLSIVYAFDRAYARYIRRQIRIQT
jgi:hypothetical protein